MRIVEAEIVTQRIKQRHVGIGIDLVLPAVDVEGEVLGHGRPPPLRQISLAAIIHAKPDARRARSDTRDCGGNYPTPREIRAAPAISRTDISENADTFTSSGRGRPMRSVNGC